jgi:hypothetical protein
LLLRSAGEVISESYSSYLDVLVSESLRGATSAGISTPLHLSVGSWGDGLALQSDYLCKARAMLIKLPGFFYSSYRQTAWQSSVVIPMHQYARVMADIYGDWPTPRLPPKQKLLVRISESATREQREDVVNGLRTFFKSDKTQVIDTRSLVATMGRAIALLDLFFTLIGAIAMVNATPSHPSGRT